ncbi:hypothetical protein [Clostridium akagii]|uniref:hypothetical protein n=1 Tax=Clostridium akagii TaxID=91623 RepID=UPI00047E3E16|nr:hypothetical protein [Clostridium akagii]
MIIENSIEKIQMKNTINNDNVKLSRFIIKKERKNYFIAINHRNKKFKILKNNYSKKFGKNTDTYMHYIIVKAGIFYTIINPISHEKSLELH